jgi:hypothetical protein
MIPINEFRRNQSRFPLEELEKYNGQYVAWSEDGTRILAADADPVRVDAMIRAAGYDPGEILISMVAVPEETSAGAVWTDETPGASAEEEFDPPLPAWLDVERDVYFRMTVPEIRLEIKTLIVERGRPLPFILDELPDE